MLSKTALDILGNTGRNTNIRSVFWGYLKKGKINIDN